MRADSMISRTFRALPILITFVLLTDAQAGAAELKFIPMIDVRENYNNNLFFEQTRIQGVHDTITTVSPGARLTDRTETLDAFLQSWFHVLRYRDNDDLDAMDQDHSGRVRYRFTERWSGSVDGRYVKDSRLDKDFEESGTVTGTARRDRTHYGGSTEYSLSEKAACSLSYAYDEDRFNDHEFVDSTIQNADLGFSYDLGSMVQETMFQANVGYALYHYPREDVVENSCSVGIRKWLNETFSMSGFIGRSLTRSTFEISGWEFIPDYPYFALVESEVRSKERGTIGQVMFSYKGEYTTADISCYQDIRGLSGSSGTTRRKGAVLNVRRRFTRKLTGSLAVECFQDKAHERQLAASDIDEQNLRIQPGMYYYFNDDLFLHASYRFYRQDDFEDHLKYKQNLCSIRLVWQYPIPR